MSKGNVDKCQSLLKMKDKRCNPRLYLPLFITLRAHFLVDGGREELNMMVEALAHCIKR